MLILFSSQSVHIFEAALEHIERMHDAETTRRILGQNRATGDGLGSDVSVDAEKYVDVDIVATGQVLENLPHQHGDVLLLRKHCPGIQPTREALNVDVLFRVYGDIA